MAGGVLKDALFRERMDSYAEMAVDDPEEEVPDYLLEISQQREDFILGYHDDYRERYDGFDQPPPFRQPLRHKSPPQRSAGGDLEISEEEAFSTRVFVTTPRRQR